MTMENSPAAKPTGRELSSPTSDKHEEDCLSCSVASSPTTSNKPYDGQGAVSTAAEGVGPEGTCLWDVPDEGSDEGAPRRSACIQGRQSQGGNDICPCGLCCEDPARNSIKEHPTSDNEGSADHCSTHSHYNVISFYGCSSASSIPENNADSMANIKNLLLSSKSSDQLQHAHTKGFVDDDISQDKDNEVNLKFTQKEMLSNGLGAVTQHNSRLPLLLDDNSENLELAPDSLSDIRKNDVEAVSMVEKQNNIGCVGRQSEETHSICSINDVTKPHKLINSSTSNEKCSAKHKDTHRGASSDKLGDGWFSAYYYQPSAIMGIEHCYCATKESISSPSISTQKQQITHHNLSDDKLQPSATRTAMTLGHANGDKQTYVDTHTTGQQLISSSMIKGSCTADVKLVLSNVKANASLENTNKNLSKCIEECKQKQNDSPSSNVRNALLPHGPIIEPRKDWLYESERHERSHLHTTVAEPQNTEMDHLEVLRDLTHTDNVMLSRADRQLTMLAREHDYTCQKPHGTSNMQHTNSSHNAEDHIPSGMKLKQTYTYQSLVQEEDKYSTETVQQYPDNITQVMQEVEQLRLSTLSGFGFDTQRHQAMATAVGMGDSPWHQFASRRMVYRPTKSFSDVLLVPFSSHTTPIASRQIDMMSDRHSLHVLSEGVREVTHSCSLEDIPSEDDEENNVLSVILPNPSAIQKDLQRIMDLTSFRPFSPRDRYHCGEVTNIAEKENNPTTAKVIKDNVGACEPERTEVAAGESKCLNDGDDMEDIPHQRKESGNKTTRKQVRTPQKSSSVSGGEGSSINQPEQKRGRGRKRLSKSGEGGGGRARKRSRKRNKKEEAGDGVDKQDLELPDVAQQRELELELVLRGAMECVLDHWEDHLSLSIEDLHAMEVIHAQVCNYNQPAQQMVQDTGLYVWQLIEEMTPKIFR